jgi:hypothetical protein
MNPSEQPFSYSFYGYNFQTASGQTVTVTRVCETCSPAYAVFDSENGDKARTVELASPVDEASLTEAIETLLGL